MAVILRSEGGDVLGLGKRDRMGLKCDGREWGRNRAALWELSLDPYRLTQS